VPAPWSGARANRDYIPPDQAAQRQHFYQEVLNHQTLSKAEQRRRRAEEEKAIDQVTARSLATQTHQWGSQAGDRRLERAVYKEQLATVAHKKKLEHESKCAELEDYARWRDAADLALAHQWHAERYREKQEMQSLAKSWQMATEEKRRKAAEEKSRTLKIEQEAIAKLVEGMPPPRRLRRAADPSNFAGEVLPR